MRHNLTTPGGFFVGLGGIVAFCVVSAVVFYCVKIAGNNNELRPQQAALGLVPKPEDTNTGALEAETKKLLENAAVAYNDGRKPNIDNLAELRGVVRFRAAQNSDKAAATALNAPSSVSGKTVIEAAMQAVASEIKAKPVSKSAVALMEIAPVDPNAAPSLPNVTGGGAKTQQFADPNAKPAAAPAPAAVPAPAPAVVPAPAPAAQPAPGAPAAPAPAVPPAPPHPAPPAGAPPVPPPAAPAPAPARPPLINSSEPHK
jgi:hypothetical protein